ncbi:MAG TPA: Rieske 2Fe-2S domain-containing protein [Streptosporangiaceae bacterium]|nr:Rieske 2Fe-2S domain-containing protein [Streptosporangiaceae bacterium]
MRHPDLAAVLSDVRSGLIPAHVYNDPEIFALERDRLFSRAWVFLAHESEIPAPGDYVVRRVLADSFIVARDEGGEVRVMFNMCLHRGMQVCRAEMGNASHFRCPYRRLKLNSRMGLTASGRPVRPPLPGFAGPGLAYQGFGEFNQRHWLAQWSDHLEAEAAAR